MTMTLNTAAKNWFALNAGSGNCLAASGVVYKDADGKTQTGKSGDVIAAFVGAHSIGKDSAIIIANTNYPAIKAINDNVDLVNDDAGWAYANDGSLSGEPLYCYTAPTSPPKAIIGVTPIPFSFSGKGNGVPKVTLDLISLSMSQANDARFHFQMGGVNLTNDSDAFVFVAFELMLFEDPNSSIKACPATTVTTDLDLSDRGSYKSGPGNQRITRMDPGETASFNLDFYQPTYVKGKYTVCLLVHGTWSNEEMLAEIRGLN